jgi:hypothetical protein
MVFFGGAMAHHSLVNPKFTVETLYVGQERHPVLVIDDFLGDPQAMVDFAIRQASFKPSPLFYPGIVSPTPQEYVDALTEGLYPRLVDFGINISKASLSDSFFALVTFTPEQLKLAQRLPHVDDFNPALIATLHYFCDNSQGGTAFYRHRATGYETLTPSNIRHWQPVINQEMAQRGQIPAQYMTASNQFYEQTQAVEAKFNRMLVYRGNIFHSGMIRPTTKIDPDPRVGRLTANSFVKFEVA